MQEHFDRALEYVLEHEGGYVPASAKDPGGETKWGISKRAFPRLNVKALTVEQAGEIYRKFYWNQLKCDDIRSFLVAAKIFDTGVNMGVASVSEMVQRILREFNYRIKVDGRIGPVTLGAINAVNHRQLVSAICVEQRRHYEKLILADPDKYGKDRGGWMKRAAWFPKEAV